MNQIELHPKILLVHTDKSDGNIDIRFGSPKEVKQNRQKLFDALKLDSKQNIEGEQIHEDLILALDADNSKMWQGQKVTGVDGFTTNQSAISLMVRVADCAVVVLYDPENNAIGIFHAGWRGTVKNIHIKGLKMMARKYGTDPGQVLGWIGPSIKSCCYKSKEKPEQSDDPIWKPFITKKGGEWMIDLPGFIVESLRGEGVYKKNLKVAAQCTYHDESFFSFQQSKDTGSPDGRNAVIVKIK